MRGEGDRVVRTTMRRLDHVVVAVRDLEHAAAMSRRLGFQVGARNRHPWGTENRLIQFGSSFIELITLGADVQLVPPHLPRRFSFGAFVRDFLREREGMAMLVLSSEDAQTDAARFAEHGIGDFDPFHFERAARRPDGAETHVAFTLAFATDPHAPHAGFFVCQQHFPENFWNSGHQQHANAATNISAVTLTAIAPGAHVEFLARFCGTEPRPRPGGGFTFALDGGRIELVPAPSAPPESAPSSLLTSAWVRLADRERILRVLGLEGVPFTVSGDTIVVPADVSFGIELRFETASGAMARGPTR